MKTTEHISNSREVSAGSPAYPFSSALLDAASGDPRGDPSGRPEDGPAGIEEAELADVDKRLRVSAALAVTTLLLAVAAPAWLPQAARLGLWAQLASIVPLVAWAALPIWRRFRESVRSGRPDAFTLVGLALGLSFAFSILSLIARSLGADSAPPLPVYFDTVAVTITGVLLAMSLELRIRRQASSTIRSLEGLDAAFARRVRRASASPGEKESEQRVPVSEIRAGDKLRVIPGDRIPADGMIVIGQGWVKESVLTGQPLAIPKRGGDRVAAGTLNERGTFLFTAEVAGQEALLPRLTRRMKESQRSHSPIQERLVAPIERIWPLATLLAAAVIAAVWWAWSPEAATSAATLLGSSARALPAGLPWSLLRLTPSFTCLISVLLVACPFPLGAAARIPTRAALGRAAGEGLLFRSVDDLELLRKTDLLVINKTGILTEGRPRIAALVVSGGMDEGDLLRLAAAAEARSDHPLASAILAEARDRGLGLIDPADSFRASPGQGVVAQVGNRRVAIGNQRLMESQGVYLGVPVLNQADILRLDEGLTVVFVAVDTRLVGLIGFFDAPRKEAAKALATLKAAGVRPVLLTGDHSSTAHALARSLDISEVRAEASAEAKGAIVQELRSGGARVAVLGSLRGEAIHPASAFSQAELSIALGARAETAGETAGIVLLRDDLRALVKAREISVSTVEQIRRNLAFWFCFSLAGIPLMAGGIYPVAGASGSPLIACVGMCLSWIAVLLMSRAAGSRLR